VASFDYFSLALDKSCDICDAAQLLIFVHRAKALKTMEELATIESMNEMIGNNLVTSRQMHAWTCWD